MDLKAINPKERINAMTKAGYWSDRTLLDFFDQAVASNPGQIAIVDNNSETGKSTSLTYGELDARVRCIASGLISLGVAKGDVVSFQLPNWWQFTALHLACLRAGAITNPLMPIFRERELRFMLGFAELKVMIVPKHFRGFDYQAMMASIRSDLPHLKHVAVIGQDGSDAFEMLLLDPKLERTPGLDEAFKKNRPAANDVIQIMYTSGTTGEPKGVMHTSNTLFANILPLAERLHLNPEDSIFCPTPNAHQLGYLYGVLMPIVLGLRVVLLDVWNAEKAAALIEEHKTTFATGATPFLADLTNLSTLSNFNIGSLRLFLSAGAPIPSVLVQTATERLGATIISAWA